MKKILNLFFIAVLSFSFAACSSTTLIRSTDPDAKIYVDGEYRGKGQVSHSDSKTIGSSTSVRLEKPGCAPMSFTFFRNEEFDAGACAGGVFVLVPFLWIQKYKSEHVYDYECQKR